MVSAPASSAGGGGGSGLCSKQAGLKSWLFHQAAVTLGSQNTLRLNFVIYNSGTDMFITIDRTLCKNNHQQLK